MKSVQILMIPLEIFVKQGITLFFLARVMDYRYSPARFTGNFLSVGAWPNGKAAAFGAED